MYNGHCKDTRNMCRGEEYIPRSFQILIPIAMQITENMGRATIPLGGTSLVGGKITPLMYVAEVMHEQARLAARQGIRI